MTTALCVAALMVVPHAALPQAGRTMTEHTDSTPSVVVKKKSDTLTIGKMWWRSVIIPSYGQFFNHHYWKTPIVIGGIGGLAYAAYADKPNRTWYIAGAAAIYWASLLDATLCYRYNKDNHSPGKAAIFATLLPGLGQVYNQKYWKLPIVYGGFLAMGYLIQSRHFRLNLFSKMYTISYEMSTIKSDMANYAEGSADYLRLQEKYSTLENQIEPNFRTLSLDRIKSYKDAYRRDRDYYIILTCLFYGLTIIDAVVDAHFATYDISNDLSLHWQPYAERWAAGSVGAGVSLSIKF